MALHFTREEFADRQRRVAAALAAKGLAGLLLFRQESMYYLTGYDSFGYVFFQCLYLGADGSLVLLTRLPDLRQAEHTSTIGNIRIWVDRVHADPTLDLEAMLEERGCRGTCLGIELDAYGLTGRRLKAIEARLEGFCRLQDESDLVSAFRAIKSPAEIAHIRRAAELGDLALEEANRLAVPGAFEGDILAAMQGAVFRGDGDYPGNGFIIGSGRDALLCRYYSGRRCLDPVDQLMLEFAGVSRHYHAVLMRVILTGKASARQLAMHAACRDALLASEAAVRPGRPVGVIFDAHAQIFDAAGFRAQRLNACGYGLGATFSSCWVDGDMFFDGNPVIAMPNMVLFLDMFLMDKDHGHAMALGETVLVTETGIERLSKASLDLVVN